MSLIFKNQDLWDIVHMELSKSRKKWSSFVELKEDLLREGMEKLAKTNVQRRDREVDNFLISSVYQILEDTKKATTQNDFFALIERTSSLLQGLDKKAIANLIRETNLYILLLSAVFTNESFVENLKTIVKEEKGVYGSDLDALHLEEKKTLNTAISLALLPLAVSLSSLSEQSTTFIRLHLTKLIRFILKAINDPEISFARLCFKLESISWNYRYYHKVLSLSKTTDSFLGANLQLTRAVIGTSLLSLTINTVLEDQFKKAVKLLDEKDRHNLSTILNGIYGAIHRIDAGVNSYYDSVPEEDRPRLEGFFEVFIRGNERGLLFFIKEVSAGFEYQKGKTFQEVILEKVASADEISNNLTVFAKRNLSAFKQGLRGNEREWVNKIFIISIKSITALAQVSHAHDHSWKCSVAIRELSEWVYQIHEILNGFHPEDEFASLIPFINDEGVRIEWKSTFMTPIEDEFINEKAELAKGRDIFLRIVKTILGMLNTEGGVIIVGLVECPERILRKDIAEAVYIKGGKSFFDVGNELKNKGKTLDQVRLQILDNLRSITQTSEEKFNNLFSLEPLLIRVGERNITIVKISIEKSESLIYNCKEESGAVWVSLTKRADGKTIDVDIRDYINL